MTVDEFNEKYSAYLEEGHYGLDIDIPEAVEYLDKIFEGLIKIPGFQYSQIKSKYGTSRFYSNLRDVLETTVGYYIENNIEDRLNIFLQVDDVIRIRNRKLIENENNTDNSTRT